jgi:hypothetical protein
LGGSAPRTTSAPKGTRTEELRRTSSPTGFTTIGVTQIRTIRPPVAPTESRAVVPVAQPRRTGAQETARVGQMLDDITLIICILGVLGTLACTAAALMNWI